jgi:hypothetical protein
MFPDNIGRILICTLYISDLLINKRSFTVGLSETKKFTLEQAMKAQRGSYNSMLFLTSTLEGGGGVTPIPRRFTPWKDSVPTVQEAEWASGPVAIYRLHYPAPHFQHTNNKPFTNSSLHLYFQELRGVKNGLHNRYATHLYNHSSNEILTQHQARLG